MLEVAGSMQENELFLLDEKRRNGRYHSATIELLVDMLTIDRGPLVVVEWRVRCLHSV